MTDPKEPATYSTGKIDAFIVVGPHARDIKQVDGKPDLPVENLLVSVQAEMGQTVNVEAIDRALSGAGARQADHDLAAG